jgi:succinyl-diaminopimelate desuccinylase
MTDLLGATAEMVAIPSVSHGEKALADHIEARLRGASWLEVDRFEDNVVARTNFGLPARVLLAGHLDTVPPNDNAAPAIEGGTLWGLGAADMKGGLAVMVDLALSAGTPACDLTYVFYVAEEVERAHNGLLALASARPGLLEASAAVLCEPTACRVEAGCQGVLRAEVSLAGVAAHVARPWMGRNAIHRLGPLIGAISSFEPRRPELDGCTYQESLQAVAVRGGTAANVLPSSATLEVVYRFAPDRDLASAREALEEIVAVALETADTFEVKDSAPGAPPSVHDPWISSLIRASGEPPRAKLGWTDVAFFSERGIPAANFGPGDPELAHTKEEHVTAASLERARQVLAGVLGAAGRG